jgi:hypothetical protein
MMQAAEPWHRNNLAFHIGSVHRFTSQWRFLRKRKMSPVVVVVADVLIQQAFQMPFINLEAAMSPELNVHLSWSSRARIQPALNSDQISPA